MSVFWVVTPCSLVVVYRRFRAIALMMETASTSETSANFYQTTRRNNPEDRHFNTRRREKLRSHLFDFLYAVVLLLLTGSLNNRLEYKVTIHGVRNFYCALNIIRVGGCIAMMQTQLELFTVINVPTLANGMFG
jgi:hypothetical protein